MHTYVRFFCILAAHFSASRCHSTQPCHFFHFLYSSHSAVHKVMLRTHRLGVLVMLFAPGHFSADKGTHASTTGYSPSTNGTKPIPMRTLALASVWSVLPYLTWTAHGAFATASSATPTTQFVEHTLHNSVDTAASGFTSDVTRGTAGANIDSSITQTNTIALRFDRGPTSRKATGEYSRDQSSGWNCLHGTGRYAW